MIRNMIFTPFFLAALLSSNSFADERVVLVDDFNRNESDETKESLGKGWSTNSKSRAKGHKQADLRDGTLHIFTHAEADHAASVRHDAEFTNAVVTLRFKLEHAKDSLGLNFADPQCKEVHAGHLFRVSLAPKSLTLEDLKTGKMRLDLRKTRIAKKPVPESVTKMLKTKVTKFPVSLELNQWYDLKVQIDGQKLVVHLDGKQIGKFSSPGISHETKRLFRLAIPKEVVIDDLKIVSK